MEAPCIPVHPCPSHCSSVSRLGWAASCLCIHVGAAPPYLPTKAMDQGHYILPSTFGFGLSCSPHFPWDVWIGVRHPCQDQGALPCLLPCLTCHVSGSGLDCTPPPGQMDQIWAVHPPQLDPPCHPACWPDQAHKQDLVHGWIRHCLIWFGVSAPELAYKPLDCFFLSWFFHCAILQVGRMVLNF